MLTLRTLKKKSKQAQPILLKHYGLDPADVFLAERGVNHHEFVIRCTHGAGDLRPYCGCNSHPLKGTPMTGGMSGGEEPEWSESTLLGRLMDSVRWCGRPETMSDAEWAQALKISGATPVDYDALVAEMKAADFPDIDQVGDECRG
ncbi:hypothetical protein [Methylobacterium aquaticum]|uniref:Uncharacterized protein n=1 Tax=Methylobacterium aquaticum TaxID=270351 RepID=A0A0C6FH02_9HYPH|nr:hypothetical protein [Methylobacterium aquaticum]BAQ44349.1 hypothetical protein Maq22A_c04695 [Methylobacterium aquaticum]